MALNLINLTYTLRAQALALIAVREKLLLGSPDAVAAVGCVEGVERAFYDFELKDSVKSPCFKCVGEVAREELGGTSRPSNPV